MQLTRIAPSDAGLCCSRQEAARSRCAWANSFTDRNRASMSKIGIETISSSALVRSTNASILRRIVSGPPTTA